MTDTTVLLEQSNQLANEAASLSDKAVSLAEHIANLQVEATTGSAAHVADPFVFAFTVFILACFIGYYVVWKVTPALHTPLMSVTNAISSIIIVGAILAAGTATSLEVSRLGLIAIAIASVNIFGGFVVTQRMLHMFKKKG